MDVFSMNEAIITLVIVLVGNAHVAEAQSVAVPVVATFFATAIAMLIIFGIVLYCCRKKWKKSAQDRVVGGGFDNPLVLDHKENGGAPNAQEDELREVVTEAQKEEQPTAKNEVQNQGFQERAVDVGGLQSNGQVPSKIGDKDEVHTVVLNKTTPTNGFNIVSDDSGNVFIRDVREDGPATGKIVEGDIIESVTVFYESIAYEDALNVLSYAAPYKVAISLVRGKNQLMPGAEIKSDPFVEELQQQLEKRVSQKQPVEEKEEDNKPVGTEVVVSAEQDKQSASSSSSSSEDEKAPDVTDSLPTPVEHSNNESMIRENKAEDAPVLDSQDEKAASSDQASDKDEGAE